MQSRVLILGAGFGGLELATILSEALGDEAGVTHVEFGAGRGRRVDVDFLSGPTPTGTFQALR